MAEGKALAVTQLVERLRDKQLDDDRRLRVVKEWTSSDEGGDGAVWAIRLSPQVTLSEWVKEYGGRSD
jgi:hypothetical protein